MEPHGTAWNRMEPHGTSWNRMAPWRICHVVASLRRLPCCGFMEEAAMLRLHGGGFHGVASWRRLPCCGFMEEAAACHVVASGPRQQGSLCSGRYQLRRNKVSSTKALTMDQYRQLPAFPPNPPSSSRHIWHSGLQQEVHSASLDNIAGVRITKWRKHQAGAGMSWCE